MHKFLTLSAAFLLLAGTAQAGALTSASWVGSFQGTPFTLTTGGGSLTATGSSASAGSASAAVSVVSNASMSITISGPPIVTITQTLMGSQTIGVNGSVTSVNQGIAGVSNVFLNVGIPLFFFAVPLSVGVSAMATTNTNNPAVGQVDVTVTFGAWTNGAVSVTGLFGTTTTVSGATNMTVAFPDLLTGGGTTTAGGIRTVTLVSPATVNVCIGGAPTCNGSVQSFRTASATVLTLRYSVPEPRTLLLLGAGLASLAALGRGWRS